MLRGPQNLPERVRAVRERIAQAAARAGRNAHFGESYLQEALQKLDALQDRALTWHFVGRIQANKTRAIAEAFAWAHAVDRLKIAARLSEQRPHYAPPLNVCLQVRLADEAAKGGVAAGELAGLARQVALLPRLRLRGLMCIPPEETQPERQRAWFRELRRHLEALNSGGAALDTLSMGMSGDFEAAIEEGATIVRVGTALFGPRPR
jgi:pyridoxal phosphate enzyme (YggS family)